MREVISTQRMRWSGQRCGGWNHELVHEEFLLPTSDPGP